MLFTNPFLVIILILPACLSSNSDSDSLNVPKIRSEILKFMELPDRHETPNHKRCDVPRYLEDLYHNKIRKPLSNDATQSRQDTIRVFFAKGRVRKSNTLIYEFRFNLSSIHPSDGAITYAELRLHRRRTKVKGLIRLCSLALFCQQHGKQNKNRNTALTFIKIKVLPLSGKALWIRYNVSAVVTEHLKRQRENMIQFKVYVQAYGTSLPSRMWINRHGKNRPFLVVFSRLVKNGKKILKFDLALPPVNSMEISVKRRSKRGNKHGHCQRRRMFVKFSSLKMNWVIAPTGFSAYQCEGTCPEVLTSYFNPTNHAILQNLVHYRYAKHVPQASCVPTRLDSLTVLYRDVGDSITLREFPEMVVSSCGCR